MTISPTETAGTTGRHGGRQRAGRPRPRRRVRPRHRLAGRPRRAHRAWADDIAARLVAGRRLLAAGNGGSAAEAQHLTSELTGRFDGDRPAYSAISLHAESSAVTAIGNDYGYDEVFARQVRAHARAGDVVVLLSTSGKSPNLLRAAEAARAVGAFAIALTGPRPNPLASIVDDAICIDGPSANVQEAQLVLVHALCRAMEPALRRGARR